MLCRQAGMLYGHEGSDVTAARLAQHIKAVEQNRKTVRAPRKHKSSHIT